MFEKHEIMRLCGAKLFTETLNRLRDGKHTKDIVKSKKTLVQSNSKNYPPELPLFFVKNDEVNKFKSRVHIVM